MDVSDVGALAEEAECKAASPQPFGPQTSVTSTGEFVFPRPGFRTVFR